MVLVSCFARKHTTALSQIWKPSLLQFSLFLSCPNVTAPRTPDSNIIFLFLFLHIICIVLSFFLACFQFAFLLLPIHTLCQYVSISIRLLSLWLIFQFHI